MSNSTEAATVLGPWLKWAWYHQGLYLDDFDTFEAAVASTIDADESLMAIEGPDGEVPDDAFEAERSRQVEIQQAAADSKPRSTHGVRISAPGATDKNRDWAWAGSFPSEGEAEALAERLRGQFGDRVTVVALPTGPAWT